MPTVKRLAIQLLDRGFGRYLLAAVANQYAARENSRVFWDGAWAHRTGESVIVDSLRFSYYAYSFSGWRTMESNLADEARDFWFYAYHPKPGDVIVDIGAGRGEYLLPMARAIGTTGRVFAIEAHPETFACLRAAIRLNGLSNVTAIHAAITDKPGTVSINTGADWLENSVMSGGDCEVQAMTLDMLIESHSIKQVDFLKMNIEGAETLAVTGLSKLVRRIRNLNISCHDFRADRGEGEFYRTKQQVINTLETKGFHLSFRDDQRPFIRDQVIASWGE